MQDESNWAVRRRSSTIPYPTVVRPQELYQILRWQQHVRGSTRRETLHKLQSKRPSWPSGLLQSPPPAVGKPLDSVAILTDSVSALQAIDCDGPDHTVQDSLGYQRSLLSKARVGQNIDLNAAPAGEILCITSFCLNSRFVQLHPPPKKKQKNNNTPIPTTTTTTTKQSDSPQWNASYRVSQISTGGSEHINLVSLC